MNIARPLGRLLTFQHVAAAISVAEKKETMSSPCWLATLLMVPWRHFGGAHFGLI
jgi:hypothetical protein